MGTYDLPNEKELTARNPFTKRHFNLTHQAVLHQSDRALHDRLKAAAPAIDAEAERIKRTRSLYEFNQLDAAGKIAFIRNGGEVS